MAGFDFTVESSETERPFLRSLMRLAQRLASFHGLKFRYRWSPSEGYYATVDGSLPSMQAFLDPLVVGLLSHAEGATEYPYLQKRKQIARRVTGAYADGLDGMTETVEGVSAYLGGTPSSYSFDVGRATHLIGHLNGLTNALTLYHQGRLRPHQIAEDLHTCLEMLLREVLGSDAEERSFEEKVHLAVQSRLLDRRLVGPIIKLKNHRRDAKHRGQGISCELVDSLLPSALSAVHRLTRLLRHDSAEGKLGG